MNQAQRLTTSSQEGYSCIATGDGMRYERWGAYTTLRPDPQALWPHASSREWARTADAVFSADAQGGSWKSRTCPEMWNMDFAGFTIQCRRGAFKHVGIFPEHAPHWAWMENAIRESTVKTPRVLNLFGYTGIASLACARAGAEVVHVDASKPAITQGRENQNLSHSADLPIRWIPEDARIFVKRELQRGSRYDGILLDPPAFGHGPKGTMWHLEKHLLELLKDCKALLSDRPLFFLLNGYASGYSSVTYAELLATLFPEQRETIEHGELTLEDEDHRLLPSGIYARMRYEA